MSRDRSRSQSHCEPPARPNASQMPPRELEERATIRKPFLSMCSAGSAQRLWREHRGEDRTGRSRDAPTCYYKSALRPVTQTGAKRYETIRNGMPRVTHKGWGGESGGSQVERETTLIRPPTSTKKGWRSRFGPPAAASNNPSMPAAVARTGGKPAEEGCQAQCDEQWRATACGGVRWRAAVRQSRRNLVAYHGSWCDAPTAARPQHHVALAPRGTGITLQ